jgi:hypothetical protein
LKLAEIDVELWIDAFTSRWTCLYCNEQALKLLLDGIPIAIEDDPLNRLADLVAWCGSCGRKPTLKSKMAIKQRREQVDSKKLEADAIYDALIAGERSSKVKASLEHCLIQNENELRGLAQEVAFEGFLRRSSHREDYRAIEERTSYLDSKQLKQVRATEFTIKDFDQLLMT